MFCGVVENEIFGLRNSYMLGTFIFMSKVFKRRIRTLTWLFHFISKGTESKIKFKSLQS